MDYLHALDSKVLQENKCFDISRRIIECVSYSLAKGDDTLLFSYRNGAYRHPWLAKICVPVHMLLDRCALINSLQHLHTTCISMNLEISEF